MARRKKFIQVPPGVISKLCADFHCHKTAVYDALNYTTESELAFGIREKALGEYGGVRTSKLVLKRV